MYSGVLSNKGVYIDAVKFDGFRLLMIRSAGCRPAARLAWLVVACCVPKIVIKLNS